MKKKLLVLLMAVMFVMMAIAGCTAPKEEAAEAPKSDDSADTQQAEATEDPNADKVMRVVSMGALTKLTIDGFSTIEMEVGRNVYSSLVWYDEMYGVTPDIATEWTVSDDGLEYIFTIAEGVTFHNGDAMTMEDILYSLDRYMATWVAYVNLAAVDSYEEVDGKLKITLFQPDVLFLKNLSQLFILDKSYIEPQGEEYMFEIPNGSGPYELVSFDEDKTVLKAYPDYFKGAAPIKNVEIVTYYDTSAQLFALQQGEVNASYWLNPIDFDIVRSDPNLHLDQKAWAYSSVMYFNFENEFLSNLDVRKAISYAINTDDIIIADMNGEAVRSENFALVEGTFGHSTGDNVSPYPYDLAKAKEYMDASGYKAGDIALELVTLKMNEASAQVITEQLSEIGIVVNIRVIDGKGSSDVWRSGDFDIVLVFHVDTMLDASWLNQRFLSEVKNNFSRYSNADVDELLNGALLEQDEAKRAAMYEEAISIFKQDAAFVSIYDQLGGYAMTADLDGLFTQAGVYYDNFYYCSWK